MTDETLKCDLCEDQTKLTLSARCHLTAPLQVSVEDGVMILRCYLPDCQREVARYTVLGGPPKNIKLADRDMEWIRGCVIFRMTEIRYALDPRHHKVLEAMRITGQEAEQELSELDKLLGRLG